MGAGDRDQRGHRVCRDISSPWLRPETGPPRRAFLVVPSEPAPLFPASARCPWAPPAPQRLPAALAPGQGRERRSSRSAGQAPPPRSSRGASLCSPPVPRPHPVAEGKPCGNADGAPATGFQPQRWVYATRPLPSRGSPCAQWAARRVGGARAACGRRAVPAMLVPAGAPGGQHRSLGQAGLHLSAHLAGGGLGGRRCRLCPHASQASGVGGTWPGHLSGFSTTKGGTWLPPPQTRKDIRVFTSLHGATGC